MKFAFCLFHYFPFGGLQRDFLRIARACVAQGHQVDVYTMSWEGPREAGITVSIVPVKAWQNHTRCRVFSKKLQLLLQDKRYDLVVGFNKMPGLDVYYAADVCYQSRIRTQKSWWYRCLPRYLQYVKDERSVFQAPRIPKVLVLSEQQREEYQRCYALPADQFHLLPPGIAPDRLAPEDSSSIREAMRKAYHVTDKKVLLLVGSGFKTKGLDRVLEGIAALPAATKANVRLWVVGQDNPAPFIRHARQLQIDHLISFLGGRHDVARFFLAADLLVHPAYHENTGTVLLEALAAGLPVLTVDVCGYAHFVQDANAGIVLPSPFDQRRLNQALQDMLNADTQPWRTQGLTFARTADIYSLPERALEQLQRIFQEASSSFFSQQGFDYFMQLSGECFREQKGRRTQRVVLNQQSYFIKQHFGVGWKEIAKNIIQGKWPILGAKNEWRAIQKLQALSIPTPRIIKQGERGLNPATKQSFLLMEELKNMISLEDYCRDWQVKPPSFGTKLALLNQVAHIARTLHENGINHRDFYICHFLWDQTAALPTVYLIDLHRAGIHRRLRKRWMIKDLAGLYFSSKDIGLTQRDLLRFMKRYRQRSLRDMMTTEKNFWKKTVKRGEKMYDAHAASS